MPRGVSSHALRETATLLPAATLWHREIVRFLRQKNRVLSAIAQPALFWLLFGAGFGRSFEGAGAASGAGSFLEYLFPGTVVLIVLFTAIFSAISIIEDRNAGFLQSVLVAPVSRAGIVLGKVSGCATLALVQGLVFLCLAPIVGVPVTAGSFALGVASLALVSFALASLGVAVAWPMQSVQGFHAVMMLFLMPMWLLSGAFFPLEGAPVWLGWVMRANPLTYGVAMLRRSLYAGGLDAADTPSWAASVGVTAVFAAVAFAAAMHLVGRRSEKDVT